MHDPVKIVLVLVLIFALFGAAPMWPYSRSWGYGPGGLIGLVLVIFLILILLGRF